MIELLIGALAGFLVGGYTVSATYKRLARASHCVTCGGGAGDPKVWSGVCFNCVRKKS